MNITNSGSPLPTEDLRGFAVSLYEARINAHLTQKDLCQRIRGATGVLLSESTISRWENQERPVDLRDVLAIETTLNLPPGALTRRLGFLPLTSAVLGAIDLLHLSSKP